MILEVAFFTTLDEILFSLHHDLVYFTKIAIK